MCLFEFTHPIDFPFKDARKLQITILGHISRRFPYIVFFSLRVSVIKMANPALLFSIFFTKSGIKSPENFEDQSVVGWKHPNTHPIAGLKRLYIYNYILLYIYITYNVSRCYPLLTLAEPMHSPIWWIRKGIQIWCGKSTHVNPKFW